MTVTVQILVTPLPSRAAHVIVAVPFFSAVTRPFSSTVATVISEEFHAILLSFASLGYTKNLVIALLFAIITVVLLVRFWTVQCCIGFIISGFLIYKAIELKLDYADGKIKEKAVICASVRYNAASHMMHVTFREDSNDEAVPLRYYTFNIPERTSLFTRSTDAYTSSEFEMNHVYVIYFKDTNDSNLLGYVEL